MSELITFDNYRPAMQPIEDIYRIGAIDGGSGVAHEMAMAFGCHLSPEPTAESFAELMGNVGPARTLQDNIGLVQERLGRDESGVELAREWVNRSGLLTPVERTFGTNNEPALGVDLVIMTGGVRNWMQRRAERLVTFNQAHHVGAVLLAAGCRTMNPKEGLDVEEGMTEADYMENVIKPQLAERSVEAEVLRTKFGDGRRVSRELAVEVANRIDPGTGRVAVVSNAGAWVQNAGELGCALEESTAGRFAPNSDQLIAVSDHFELGTGAEPTATHQNPYTALGQIARNLRQLAVSTR